MTELKFPFHDLEDIFLPISIEGKNMKSQCKLCPGSKVLSCSTNSSANLKKHVAKMHPDHEAKIQAAKKRKADTMASPCEKLKQSKLSADGRLVEVNLTQAAADEALLKFITESLQPFSICDADNPAGSAFRNYVATLQPKRTVMCSKTVKSRLNSLWDSTKGNIINIMSNVRYVATTADCWSCAKRGYIGVTVHWINCKTLKREQAALACRRLKGKHTFDILAKELTDIYCEYNIQNKNSGTTTDSGSNFVKAFRIYGEVENGSENENTGEGEGADINCIEIYDVLEESQEDAQLGYHLPMHFRCASHMLNLIATKDSEAAMQKSVVYKRILRTTMAKCQSLWNKQNMSTVASDTIKQKLGVYLITPCVTRWNSTYNSLEHMKKLISHGDNIDSLDSCCDALGLPRFHAREIAFLKEYTEVLAPVAQALDLLQRENGMYMGYLLPVLYKLKEELDNMLHSNHLESCQPLVQVLSSAVIKRFEKIWTKKHFLIASCVHPKFKLQWVPEELKDNCKRFLLEELIKIKKEARESAEALSPIPIDTQDDDDYFFKYPSTPYHEKKQDTKKILEEFLEDSNRKLDMLLDDKYQTLREIFVKYNTSLPTSASVERMFNLAKLTLGDRRHSLNDQNFEVQLLLKLNSKFVNK